MNLGASCNRPFASRRAVIAQPREQVIRISIDREHCRKRCCHKSLGNHLLDHGEQWTEIAVHIQQSAGFRMDTQLRPCPLLKYLFEGARTPWQGYESICNPRHDLLPLMHCVYYTQFAQSLV